MINITLRGIEVFGFFLFLFGKYTSPKAQYPPTHGENGEHYSSLETIYLTTFFCSDSKPRFL